MIIIIIIIIIITGKYVPRIIPYLDTFHAVKNNKKKFSPVPSVGNSV